MRATQAPGTSSEPIVGIDGRRPSTRNRPVGQTLADNLLAARTIAGLTQQELADAAGVSRATVAQLETGDGDPRLSTIVHLAEALQISPMLLIVGKPEVTALALLAKENLERPIKLADADAERIRRLVSSGNVTDRLRAARVGA